MFLTDDKIRLNIKLDMPEGYDGESGCPLVIVIHRSYGGEAYCRGGQDFE